MIKHNSINDFIRVYSLHSFVQRHVSSLIMSHFQLKKAHQSYWMNINYINYKKKFKNSVFYNLINTSTDSSVSYQTIGSIIY